MATQRVSPVAEAPKYGPGRYEGICHQRNTTIRRTKSRVSFVRDRRDDVIHHEVHGKCKCGLIVFMGAV